MKRIMPLVLGVLLLSPAVLSAAAGNSAPERPAATVQPQKLDLNVVSSEELVAVPGIGPRMAQAIVDLRAKKGSFKAIEDLLEVSGIKEKKLAALAKYLEVLPLSTAAKGAAPAAKR